MILEKCERATQGETFSKNEMSQKISKTVNEEIQEFLEDLQNSKKPLGSEDDEVNELVSENVVTLKQVMLHLTTWNTL